MNYYEVSEYNDVYFTKAKQASKADGMNSEVLFQVFQKKNSIFAGGVFVIDMLNEFAEQEDKYFTLQIMPDGSKIEPMEPVIHLRGDFQDLVEFETAYLGIIARCTRIATNVREVVDAANGKPILFFPARFDIPETQFYDGYAAGIGGATGVSTKKQAEGFALAKKKHVQPVGTMSHAMIANFAGDTVRAALAVAKARPTENQTPLVDFHNNCAKTAIEVYLAFKEKGLTLDGVRIDTSEKMIDEGIKPLYDAELKKMEDRAYTTTDKTILDMEYHGVNSVLVHHVRKELDAVGATDVKIIVSGGFNAEKIRRFEAERVPADVYAVGESLLGGANPFTSDVVQLFEGEQVKPMSKVGREFQESKRLKLIIGELAYV